LLGGAWTYISGGYASREDVQVLAVCDAWKERRETARQKVNANYEGKFGAGKYTRCEAYNDFRELLDRRDIDAVLIASPVHWHSVMTVMAAQAGKDMYCEKPTAITIRESQAMLRAVQRYGRVFQGGTQQRSEYGAKFRRTCELVRSGRIGRLRLACVFVDVSTRSARCTALWVLSTTRSMLASMSGCLAKSWESSSVPSMSGSTHIRPKCTGSVALGFISECQMPVPTDTGPLRVLRYQPVGDVDIAPDLSVTFSQPMVPLGTLAQLDQAASPQDMNLPGWRLHALKGDLAGFWSVWVSGNWRLIFRFERGDAVLVDYRDYH
jgi:hypothetical protein